MNLAALLLLVSAPEAPTLDQLQVKYQVCLGANAKRLAKVKEPANNVATAVMVACRPARAVLWSFILDKPKADPELVKVGRKFLVDAEVDQHDRLIAQIVELRASSGY